MSFSNFLSINLPYGMEMNSKNEWFVFNREYKPLGWKTRDRINYEEYPIYDRYKGLTETMLVKLAARNGESIERNESGEICRIWLYLDDTNPVTCPKAWPDYTAKLKALSKLKATRGMNS